MTRSKFQGRKAKAKPVKKKQGRKSNEKKGSRKKGKHSTKKLSSTKSKIVYRCVEPGCGHWSKCWDTLHAHSKKESHGNRGPNPSGKSSVLATKKTCTTILGNVAAYKELQDVKVNVEYTPPMVRNKRNRPFSVVDDEYKLPGPSEYEPPIVQPFHKKQKKSPISLDSVVKWKQPSRNIISPRPNVFLQPGVPATSCTSFPDKRKNSFNLSYIPSNSDEEGEIGPATSFTTFPDKRKNSFDLIESSAEEGEIKIRSHSKHSVAYPEVIDVISSSDDDGVDEHSMSDYLKLGVNDKVEESKRTKALVATPWAPKGYKHYFRNPCLSLHRELIDFATWAAPSPAEAIARRTLIKELEQVITDLWPHAGLVAFGSSVTGLALPTSDIDATVFGCDEPDKLNILAERLRLLRRVSSLEVIGKARVPLVKFTDLESNIPVDISFDIESGIRTARLTKKLLEEMPAAKPMIMVLKCFLSQRKLHETYTGGIGSFCTALMVFGYLQQHARLVRLGKKHSTRINLGNLLLGFLQFWGRDFNYASVGLSLRNGGSLFSKKERGWYNPNRPGLLAIENPDEPEMDVGKNSWMNARVQQAFHHAYLGLRNALISNDHRRSSSNSSRTPEYIPALHVMIRSDYALAQRLGNG